MNRLVALTLAAGLACVLAAGTAGAAEPEPQTLLTNAILCKGDPLEILRKMAASGSSHYAQGYAGATFGAEIDELNVVVLRSPLKIAGAETSAVVKNFTKVEEDFEAYVYGRFRGDYHQAVSALKLVPTVKKDGLRLGQFTRATGLDLQGRPEKHCSKTIALTPRDDGTFLLGCGWCDD